MNRYKFILTLFLLTTIFLSACKSDKRDTIVNNNGYDDIAVLSINDKKYYESDIFEFAYNIIRELDEADYSNSRIKDLIGTEFIEHNLLYIEAEKEGLAVNDYQLDKVIGIVKTDQGNYALKILTNSFASDGNKMSKLIQQQSAIRKLLVNKLDKEISIAEWQLLDYYNKGLGVAATPSKLKLSQIYSKDKAVIDKAMEELKQGIAFSEVAERYSDSFESSRGGSLWYMQRDNNTPEFIVEALKIGYIKFSDIIQSDYGYHIFKVDRATREKKPSFEKLKRTIESEIRSSEEDRIIRGYINELAKKYNVTFINDFNLNNFPKYVKSRGY